MFGSLLAIIFGALVTYYAGYSWKILSVNGQATRKEGVESPLNTDEHTHMRPCVTLFSTSSLPVEIMLAILSQVIEKPPLSRDRAGWFERRFALGLSHVCSFWRSVMMENKSMWRDVSVLWDQHTIDLYIARAGDLPIQYHLVMEGPSSRRRAESWSLDNPVQEFIRPCLLRSGSSPARKLNIDLQLGGWPGFGRGIIGDNLGRVLERIEAPHLQALSINGIETPRLRITDAAFKDSEGLQCLRTVSLTNLTVANRSAFFHPGLTHLSLYKVQVEWGTFTLLRRLPNLRTLSMSPLTVTLVSVSAQCSLPCLQSLTLRGPVRDLNSFMASLIYPHTCSIDLCLMETMGADLDKNTSYAQGVFTTLRERLAPYGSVDVFNHLDLETDPFSVRFTFSHHTPERIPAPTTQTMAVTLVAFLPHRNFLLNPFLNAHLPGIECIRTVTSTYSALDEGGLEFPHHLSLWASIVNRTRPTTICVLRGRAENAMGFFDALEAASTEPTLLPVLNRVELVDMDLGVEISEQPALLDAGSSFWTIINRRSELKFVFHECYIPDEARQKLSHIENVSISPE